jgi:hypothetical protein
MLDPVNKDDPGYVVAWHSKSKHEAGADQQKVMTWGEADDEAAKLRKAHPENTYWAEHAARDHSHH